MKIIRVILFHGYDAIAVQISVNNYTTLIFTFAKIINLIRSNVSNVQLKSVWGF